LEKTAAARNKLTVHKAKLFWESDVLSIARAQQ